MTTTLPHNFKQVPDAAAALDIRPQGELPTYDGVAFNAHVHYRGDDKRFHQGEMIGLISNEGRGGGTWFRPAAVGANDFWMSLTAEHKALLQEHDPDTVAFAEEDLADALYDNAQLFKEMNRRRNVVVLPDKNDTTRILVSSVPGKDLEKARGAIRTQYPGSLVWIKKKGWEEA